jgi:hypothetical protein
VYWGVFNGEGLRMKYCAGREGKLRERLWMARPCELEAARLFARLATVM